MLVTGSLAVFCLADTFKSTMRLRSCTLWCIGCRRHMPARSPRHISFFSSPRREAVLQQYRQPVPLSLFMRAPQWGIPYLLPTVIIIFIGRVFPGQS